MAVQRPHLPLAVPFLAAGLYPHLLGRVSLVSLAPLLALHGDLCALLRGPMHSLLDLRASLFVAVSTSQLHRIEPFAASHQPPAQLAGRGRRRC
jgi:hypothetical protein